ncbi:hypothetical protein GHT06_012056 [Daphnia sinensis]|uniref:Uncharacterized protein n=1 Tax=Daphnia sinensis TaxID=1820382 RepID=A0AAD5KWU1_9CRUS|nr:hypothetical protein GHT06_012056 [Daphnia sinensis]
MHFLDSCSSHIHDTCSDDVDDHFSIKFRKSKENGRCTTQDTAQLTHSHKRSFLLQHSQKMDAKVILSLW